MPKVANMKEIDTERLKSLIEKNGGTTAVSSKIYRTPNTLTGTLRRGTISPSVVNALWEAFGIPFEAYKKKEETQIMVDLPKVDSADLKDVAILLREISNNQLALYKRLNHLTGIGTRIEDLLTKIEEKIK